MTALSLALENKVALDFKAYMSNRNVRAIDVLLTTLSWEQVDLVKERATANGLICGDVLDRKSTPNGPFVIAVAVSARDLEKHESER